MRPSQQVFNVKALAKHISSLTGPCEPHPQEVLRDPRALRDLKRQAVLAFLKEAKRFAGEQDAELKAEYPDQEHHEGTEHYMEGLFLAILHGGIGPGLSRQQIADLLFNNFSLADLCKMTRQIRTVQWY